MVQAFVDRARPRLSGLGGYVVPFLLVLYLGLESGGYDLITRSQVGIVCWWAILIGVAAGIWPAIRVTRIGWLVLGLLGALTVWTVLALLWTQSSERTVIEVSRAITLSGFLLLLLVTQGKEGLRRSVSAVGAAVAIVAAVALLSRYQPGWFDVAVLPDNYPKARLNFPIGYWNGLAALLAMGSVSLLWIASFGRSLIGRSLAAASLALMVLAIYLTASRGGLVELAAALTVLLVFSPGRVRILLASILPAIGTAALLLLLAQRPELRDNLVDSFGSQGTEMMWFTLVIFVLIAGINYLLGKVLEGRLQRLEFSREVTKRIGFGFLAVLVVAVVVAVASGFVTDTFNDFKRPVGPETATVERLGSVNSGERYEQWVSAFDAGKTEPLGGIGPGAYEFWWSREGDDTSFVRDAHSFYLEGFAEIGIPGLLLTLALVLVPIAIALVSGSRSSDRERRSLFIAAAAGMTAFAVAAGIDWAWETTVLVAAFLTFVAAIAGPDAETRRGRLHAQTFRLPLSTTQRSAVLAVSVAAIVVIAVPAYGTHLVESSQSSYRQGDVSGAIDKASRARDVMPWASTADIQLALLKLGQGQIDEAREVALDGTKDDPYNWRTWLVLAQVEDRAGDADGAADALEKVSELNQRYATE
jgi:hypothetical protein